MNSIADWIQSNFKFQKHNIRPWGTYELQVSTDGVSWAHFSKPFGWGFTEIRAFEILLNDGLKDVTIRQQLESWMGKELLDQWMELNKSSDIVINTKLLTQ